MRSAERAPMPLMCLSAFMSAFTMALQNAEMFMLLRMASAVFAPMPFTVMRSLKISISFFVANPKSWSASSRTCR